MEKFGWTERELYEENSLARIEMIIAEANIRAGIEEIREQEEKLKAKQGTLASQTLHIRR